MDNVCILFTHSSYIFTGTLPKEWGDMKNLTYFSVRDNKMTGKAITYNLYQWWLYFCCSLLLDTILYDIYCIGTLPPEWRKLTAMSLMYVDRNDFSGTIPHGFMLPCNLYLILLVILLCRFFPKFLE